MFRSLKIVYRLFRNSFVITGILYLVALLLFLTVVALKDAYKSSLQNEFATKQPHIKISYIDNDLHLTQNQIEREKKKIEHLSNKIDAVTPYVEGNKFFNSTGFKEGGDAQYSGDIKIIGLGTKSFVYDFFHSSFVSRKPFEIKYTPLEFLYALRTTPNLMVFNNTLFHSYFPVIQSAENFVYENSGIKYRGQLASVFNDYDKKAIIYTTIPFANTLLEQRSNKIDGFFVNAKELHDIDALTDILKKSLSKKRFIVSSWLELRAKQFMMFYLFEALSLIIISVILFLSILFIMLLLYNAIVKKSYQLSVLFTLGFPLKKELFFSITFVTLFVTMIASFFIYQFLPKVVSMLHLPYDNSMLYSDFLYMGLLDAIFLTISSILIENAYKIKAKSVF